MLEIESHSEAFGDANHPTTQMVLAAQEGLWKQINPRTICDMGCGSGILSIRAAQLWPDARVMAADMLKASVEATRKNAAHNQVQLTAVHSDGFTHPEIEAAAPYDLIVMNILAEPILRLIYDAQRLLAPQGVLILSGMLQWQQTQIIDACQLLEMEMTHRFNAGDWVLQLWVKP